MKNKKKKNWLKLISQKNKKGQKNEELTKVPEKTITEMVEEPIDVNEEKPIDEDEEQSIIESPHNEESLIKIRNVPFKQSYGYGHYKKIQYSFIDEDEWHDIIFNVEYGYPFLTINVYSDYEEFEKLKKKLKTYKDVLKLIQETDKRHTKLIEEDKARKQRSTEIGY